MMSKKNRPSLLFPFAILLFIFPLLNVSAKPVIKDASLTQHYLKLRSNPDEQENNPPEALKETAEKSKAQDFWSSSFSSEAEPPSSPQNPDGSGQALPSHGASDPWKVAEHNNPAPTETGSTPHKQDPHLEMVTPYFEALRRWKNPPLTLDIRGLDSLQDGKRKDKEKGIALPLQSNLQITGHKSVTVEMNKTHYFGQSDVNRFGGSFAGSGYGSGLDLGLTSSYGYDSSSDFGGGYGGYGDYGGGGYSGGYGGFQTSGYGGVPRASGLNIRQTLEVGLNGRVGEHTHVAVDYSDSGDSFSSGYGGYGGGIGGAKQQKIRVWYEGTEGSFLKTLAFGDITLNLPNTRFLNVNRNLFGLEAVAERGGLKMTAFGSRSKGISETRRFRGESRRAGGYGGYGGRGLQIADANYVKERFYFIQLGVDGLLHDSYLPIKQGSEEIYIDDNVAGNNQGGQRTVRGYFNLQFPGQDYNINYKTGEIEFLTPISASYEVVVAYEYLGEGGGKVEDSRNGVGNPGNVFADENGDGSIDEEGEEIGYVTIKGKSLRGTEARRVYNLGNRNISPRDYQITIGRQGGGEAFQTANGPVPYIQIFGVDRNGDGIVDPEFIDFDRGLLTFPTLRPFVIEDAASPYYQYRDQLNNEAIYIENPRTTDQVYTIIADYAYQSESYNVGLFVIPGSETVRLNGRKLRRDVDYTMIYEVGSINFFTQLDEFDEIQVEFERTPFGSALQQTVAGVWLEYSYNPKAKAPAEQKKSDRFDRLGGGPGGGEGVQSPGGFETGTYGEDKFGGGGSYGSFGGGYDSSGYGGGGYGDGYGGSSSYSSLGGSSRRGLYSGGESTYFNPVFKKGFNLSTGYILNTGQQPSRIPDVNGAPSRLQAFNINTSFGQSFNLAGLLNPLPLISVQNFPLSIDFSGEAAYSHNNPNSAGVALIDSMEGARDASSIPTFKYNWRVSSLPLADGVTLDNRALFRVLPKDKEDSQAVGNYMRNREVPASVINPLAGSTETNLVMQVGYDFADVIEEWGGFSYGLSASGADFSDREFLEVWLHVRGDENVTLHIDLGVVSEDSDRDNRLDSEDLPRDLEDINGDGKIDTLDLDLENLLPAWKFSANGSLDTGEDEGWDYDGTFPPTRIGAGNKVLDTEDLNGDGVLDSLNSYFEISIPLNNIPQEWLKSRNKNGWTFLSIPLSEVTAHGSRLPNLGFVQHLRFWLQKNKPGSVNGTLEWSSIEIVGNRWERGLVTKNGTVVTDTSEKFIVGTKDNYNFDDYQVAYDQIKDNATFKKLHPFTETTFGFQQRQQREQALTLNYVLLPDSFGVTSQRLRGLQQGEGQDFSKHDKLRLWVHGDKGNEIFVLQLAPSIRTGYRSYLYSSDPFADPQQQNQEEEVNIFENLKDFYEYTLKIDFDGWKLIEINLRDVEQNEYPDSQSTIDNRQPTINNQQSTIDNRQLTIDNQQPTIDNSNEPDGHPDGFVVRGTNSSQLSIKNIGGILLGIRNDTGREVSGEVWVNEIHLSDPLVRSGWARRGNLSVGLGNLLKVNSGYARQDKDFESSAGETGRQRQQDLGFSTTSNDFNIDTDLNLFRWLPIRYSVREQESETESRPGSFSSFQSGKSKTHNRDFSVQFNQRPLPALGFAYNRQNFWNERQGTEISDLYTSTLRFNLGQKLGFDVQHRHEDVATDPSTATDTSGSGYSSYGYYGRNRDGKTDSGTISINISPVASFSLNPSYDIRRELEKRDATSQSTLGIPSVTTPTTTTAAQSESKPKFTLASREHRLSLNPRLNRDFLGMRPTITNRVNFRENWFSNQKDASINANIRFGLSMRPRVWFDWLFPKPEPEKPTKGDKGTSGGGEQKEKEGSRAGGSPVPNNGKMEGEGEAPAEPSNLQGKDGRMEGGGEPPAEPSPRPRGDQPQPAAPDSFEEELRLEERRQREREQLERMGIDRQAIEEAEGQRGDWISRDKAEMERKLRERGGKQELEGAGLLRRSLNSLAMNGDVSFDTQDSLRRLKPGMSVLDVLRLPDEAEERTQSRKGTRYGFRTSVDPWKWLSLGGNISLNNSFTKTSSTSSRSESTNYEGNMKLINAKNTASLQLRYSYTLRDQSNINTQIGESTSHEPSLSWSQSWGQATKTALGVRLTLSDQQRSGIGSTSLIITPNVSIDYRLRVEGGLKMPVFGKRLTLKHDLDLTNTFSTVIRREKFGANREERSERYETTLRTRYNLSTRLSANLNLGLSYNNDHVEEGRDFFSVASSMTVQGEFQ